MKKNILQAVSGGYDSTYLLIKNLQGGNFVVPLYIHAGCVDPVKQLIESTVIKEIIQKLKLKFDNLHELLEIEMDLDNIVGINSIQPILWMLGLFKEVKNNKKYFDYNEVHIGYIMQDSSLSYLKEIKSYWKALFSFSFQDCSIPKLAFPLTKYYKEMIVNKLAAYDSEILSSCWTCEKPVIIRKKKITDNKIEAYIDTCDNCDPCKRINNTKGLFMDSKRNYKATINLNDFYDAIKTKLKADLKSDNITRFPARFISLKEIDNQSFRNNINKLIKGKTNY